jgi:hypothetical protein
MVARLSALESHFDGDGDEVLDWLDNCPNVSNTDQADADGDGVGDACDGCLNDPDNDADGDGVCGDVDNCPNDPHNDLDGDGVCGDIDNCPVHENPDQADGDGDGVGDACQPVIMFVTSQRWSGDLGGLAGADAKCQTAAAEAQLLGTYKAWLSGAGVHAVDRFVHHPGPYVRRGGGIGWGIIASDFESLLSGDLWMEPRYDEGGNLEYGSAWTGTSSGGWDSGYSCDGWTSYEGEGRRGWTETTSGQWYDLDNVPCAQQYRLYCIRQFTD